MVPGPDKDGAWPEGGDPNAVLAAVEEQVERLRTQEVTPEELDKARNQMLKSMYEDAQTLAGKATAIAEAAILAGDANRVNTLRTQIEAMTAKRLQQVARKYFDPQAVLRVIVQEDESCAFLKTDADAAAPLASDSNAPLPPRAAIDRPKDIGDGPPVAAPAEVKPPPSPLREALANGLRIVVAPNRRTPLVTVYLGITAGSCTDTKPGTADFAMQMLARGTLRGRDPQAISEQEKLAISITSGADLDDSYVMGGCLSQHLEKTVEMMAQVVQQTDFTEEEMNAFREIYISEMAIGDGTPEFTAKMEFRSRVYGEHPYGRDSIGLEAQIDAIGKEDVQQWRRKFVRPGQAVIIIAGDVDEKAAVELVKKHFTDWKAQGKRPAVELPNLPKIDKTRIYLIDRPECSQSQIFVGCAGIARSDESRFASMVVSDYFGTSTCSRLFSRILNDKGLTYNIYGSYEPRRYAGEFCINTFSRTESTAEVLKEVLKAVKSLRDEPPTDDELTRSKRYLQGVFAAQRETNSAIATDLWLAESQDLGSDYLAKMLQGIAAADAKQCQALINRTIDPNKLVIVIVGNASAMRKDLRKIAPVRRVEMDDDGE